MPNLEKYKGAIELIDRLYKSTVESQDLAALAKLRMNIEHSEDEGLCSVLDLVDSSVQLAKYNVAVLKNLLNSKVIGGEVR